MNCAKISILTLYRNTEWNIDARYLKLRDSQPWGYDRDISTQGVTYYRIFARGLRLLCHTLKVGKDYLHPLSFAFDKNMNLLLENVDFPGLQSSIQLWHHMQCWHDVTACHTQGMDREISHGWSGDKSVISGRNIDLF